MYNENEIKNELSDTQIKINKAKNQLVVVKQIEKLEKQVIRLEKSITTKRAKIEDLAKEL